MTANANANAMHSGCNPPRALLISLFAAYRTKTTHAGRKSLIFAPEDIIEGSIHAKAGHCAGIPGLRTLGPVSSSEPLGAVALGREIEVQSRLVGGRVELHTSKFEGIRLCQSGKQHCRNARNVAFAYPIRLPHHGEMKVQRSAGC